MPLLAAFATILIAYLIGAIPFGFLIARMRGVNIFEHGSGNIGATNIGRILGKPLGFLVFALDCAKGAVPVALALLVKTHFDGPLWTHGFVEVAAGLTAFLGHLFPVYLGFRGGKGVATGAGAVVVLLPIPAAVALGVWLVVLCGTRYMSLASIVAVLALWAVHLRTPTSWDWLEARTYFCFIAGALVIIKHHANIGRLLSGTENQLKDGLIMQQLTKTLHVLSLGLWFGMTVFFTFVVAFSLFETFETHAQDQDRASWFPQPSLYQRKNQIIDGPKEQGTRAAGFAIGPIFVWYFALQGACGFIALATALALANRDPGSQVHRWRVYLLLAAVALVVAGWPIERKVSQLRVPRNTATETYLDRRTDASLAAMLEARSQFGQWHLASVLINLLAILAVTGAMALAGNLESAAVKEETKPTEAPLAPPLPPQVDMGIKEGAPPA